ncbi:innexin unc-9-like [Littorina saxatilis]|uniref:innexin unc-9-like n=1 Tax=Littorina saxatilis TaxID=31220 RepID=UPI0038B4DA46
MVRNDYSLSETALTKWAAMTLALAAVTSLALRYVTQPISCHVPSEFTGSQASFAQQSCFLTESIFTPFSEETPSETVARAQFTYHHWLPFFLGVAAILCLVPHTIWRMLSGFIWLDAHALLQTIADNQRESASGRHVMLHDSALVVQAGLKGGNNVLTLVTFGRKVMFAIVSLVQVILMAVVFSPQLVPVGLEGEAEGGDFNSSIPLPFGAFLCDVSVRQLGRMHRFTLQCIMPLAQVYSKALAFFFCFFLVLFFLSSLDVLTWAGRLLIPGLKDVALQRYVSAISQSENDSQRPGSAHFLQSLGLDGRLLLALTADYCGPVAAADLTNHLWSVFKGTPRPCPAPSTSAGPAPGATGGRGDPTAIPLVTIGDKEGDAVAKDVEKEQPC